MRTLHDHYCKEHDHDHRWKCNRRPCLLHDVTSCLVCRCGKEMIERAIRTTAGFDAVRIFECPMRVDHIGHDSRLLEGSPPGRPPTAILSHGKPVHPRTLDNG